MSFRCQKCGEIKPPTTRIADRSNCPTRVVVKVRSKGFGRGTEIEEEQNWCSDCATEIPEPTVIGDVDTAEAALTSKIAPFDVSDWVDSPDSAPLR